MLDSNDELYKWFTGQVMRNLHVVFTMNPSTDGLKDRAATSPALFNRCVLNWFGDWSDGALFQVNICFLKNDELFMYFLLGWKRIYKSCRSGSSALEITRFLPICLLLHFSNSIPQRRCYKRLCLCSSDITQSQ